MEWQKENLIVESDEKRDEMIPYYWKNQWIGNWFVWIQEISMMMKMKIYGGKKESKFSDFCVKKCHWKVIFQKRKPRRYVHIFIKIMRKSGFWVKGYPFESPKNSPRVFHNLKINLIKTWKVKKRDIFNTKSQGKW